MLQTHSITPDIADLGMQVTIQIDTNPPKMDSPTDFEAPDDGDTFKGKVQKQFTLPASLLD